jgi:hypothetical protein
MGLKFHDLSPLAAMVTGKGGMGKLISQGVGGMIPAMIARDAQRRDAEEAAQAAKATSVGNVGSSGNVGTVTKMNRKFFWVCHHRVSHALWFHARTTHAIQRPIDFASTRIKC